MSANTLLTYFLYVLAWWVIGFVLVLATWKLDKKPVLIRNLDTIAAAGLMGPLALPIWLIITALTWMQKHADKRIF